MAPVERAEDHQLLGDLVLRVNRVAGDRSALGIGVVYAGADVEQVVLPAVDAGQVSRVGPVAKDLVIDAAGDAPVSGIGRGVGRSLGEGDRAAVGLGEVGVAAAVAVMKLDLGVHRGVLAQEKEVYTLEQI